MKPSIHIIFLFFFTLSLGAQSVKKAYKSLEKSDYAKAREVFNKNLSSNKEHVASNFGMAMILADDKSPYFNIVDSWAYIEVIEGRTNELSQEELEILSSYFLATEIRKTSRPVKKKIEIAVEAVESRLIKYIREENDLEAVYKVLEKYPDYRHYDNVVHIRNQFEFRKYEKVNTKAGYEEFIEKFPEAAQVPKANKYRYKMAFEEAKADNSVLSYNQYIKNYPGSDHLQQAIKLRNEAAFRDAEAKHTLMAYEGFIALYPDALQIPEARKHQHDLMYEKAKRIKSLEAYNEFIRMYPDGAYFIDVFNLKSQDLGEQYYQQTGFNSPDFKWARALDNNEYIEEASTIVVTAKGEYVIAGTTRANDTAYTDAWIVKLDAGGNMLWNKTIGQPYNDEISNLLITSDNKIVALGYTQIISDSSDYMAWMFMLEEDGSRKWNKNLGDIKIAASAISEKDEVYLSTYVNDTLPNTFYIQEMNLEGQKIWERGYVRKGVFNTIDFTDNGNVLLSGDKWVMCSDSKFYIKWEDTLKVNANFSLAEVKGEHSALIARDSIVKYYLSYELSGTQNANQIILDDRSEILSDLVSTTYNTSVLITNSPVASTLTKVNQGGNVIGKKSMQNNLKFISAVENSQGGISYLLKGNDYIILTFSSAGF
jgi:hypothetical protein